MNLQKVNGVTFGYGDTRGDWEKPSTKESLKLMVQRTGANTVIFPVGVEQANEHATNIRWEGPNVLSDLEVEGMIAYAHTCGLRVILKPMVNLTNGEWRAWINFFDHDSVPEPKWRDWFAAYTEFVLHYADIAEKTGCFMLVIGCELVNADRREAEWRELIKAVRGAYHGLITYNCDKYQEDAVTWWDAVDVISSSGYYPLNRWNQELDRISAVIQKSRKPFFFCEAGCPCREGAQYIPNDWTRQAPLSMEAQKDWYEAMFDAVRERDWVSGFGLWSWSSHLYIISLADQNDGYELYGKPAEKSILHEFSKLNASIT